MTNLYYKQSVVNIRNKIYERVISDILHRVPGPQAEVEYKKQTDLYKLLYPLELLKKKCK